MTSTLLQSSWSKFHWAQQHLNSLNAALERSFDPKTHSVSVKVEVEVTGDTAIAVVRVASVPIVRDDCGLSLGDTLQNFRAALDHLAWDLVKAGTAPNPKRPQDIYFPMATSFANWKRDLDRKLPGVPDEQRAIIRRYQPYRRGPGPRAVRLLRNLSDHDKHRVVVPVTRNTFPSVALLVEPNWVISALDRLITRPTRLEVETPLVRIELVRPQGFAGNCQVKVNGEFPVYPALPGGKPMAALGEVRNTVFEIMSEFDSIF